jgi:hypothetical protein
LPNATVLVQGELMTAPQVLTVLEATLTNMSTTDGLSSEYHASVKAEDASVEQTREAVAALEKVAAATLGTGSAAYTSLGFTAPARKAPSIEARLEGVNKARATRELHHPSEKKPEPAPAPVPATPSVTTK